MKKGDYFLNTNKECDRLSFVQSGFLRIFFETEDKEVTQWISTKGYFITDLSGFIFGQPARWTIQALTDAEIYTIRKSEYEKIKTIIPRWLELERLFIVRCFTTLEDRIFSHLSMTAEERYHFFFENNKELFNQVPLQYIASMLGMRPETFSRIRKKQLS
ncbi:Crp/Fnr family transcriptional regulator [Elizabethkingia anophelis]|nr:Crp/Fnr family transcriptional regulator [Elizabethkingia anophelis]